MTLNYWILGTPERLRSGYEFAWNFWNEWFQPFATQLHAGLLGNGMSKNDHGFLFAGRDHVLNVLNKFPFPRFATAMWPASMTYEALDPKATHRVRSYGYGKARLRINGERVDPEIDDDLKEWAVARKFVRDGRLILTWDRPTGEGHLNCRQRSRLAEVWLLRLRPNGNIQ